MAATQQRRRPPKANPKATIQDWPLSSRRDAAWSRLLPTTGIWTYQASTSTAAS